MFNNNINLHDFVVLAEKLRGQGFKIITKLFGKTTSRIEQTWAQTDTPPVNWWDIPEVHNRWNKRITGDAQTDWYRYVTRKYFEGKGTLTALSMGCGSGQRELQWAKACPSLQIEAFDISASRIAFAGKTAAESGLDKRVHFFLADVHKLEPKKEQYDIVFAEGSLHHFSSMRKIITMIRSILKPGGYLIVNDYVGPSRFQWTERQLQIVNGILSILPVPYRRKWGRRSIKSKVYRPGRLSMYLNDPSEAADSSGIVPCLEEMFDIKERTELGGTILQLLFKDIAYHFIKEDPMTRLFLQLIFKIEDDLLAAHEIKSDFIFCIGTKKNQNDHQSF